MRRLRLRGSSGPRRGQEFVFSGPRVRIGRSRDNDLILSETDDPRSSGHHAEALAEGGRWWIVDRESANGTWVNNQRVTRHRLAAGDVITIGDHQFVVAGVRRPIMWTVVAMAALVAVVGAAAYATRQRTPVSPQDIAATAARSVYAIVIEQDGRRSILGTAFAVRTDGVLATSAHIADLIGQRRALAVLSDTFDARRIAVASLHPKWKRGSMSFDAALLRLEPGSPLAPLTIADPRAFERVHRGLAIASFGFPAASTDPVKPRGRLAIDVVGDVRGDYVQTGLAIAPGTSGSPVFDDSGLVVAIVAGGDFVADPNGRVAPSGSAANWAISASVLRELLGARR